MKNKPNLKRIFSMSIYGTVNKSAYSDYKYEISRLNLTFCKAMSVVSALIFLLVVIFSFVFSYGVGRYIYLGMFIAYAVASVFIWVFVPKHLSSTLPVLYIGTITAFALTILLGTYFSTDYNAVIFFILLIGLSILIIDRPYRVYLIILASGVSFIFASYFLKPYSIFVLDMADCFVAMAVSAYLANISVRLRLDNIEKEHEFKEQIEMDNLTKLYTRLSLENKVASREDYEGIISSLLLMDIDDFKSVNDIYGHSTGDGVLVYFANQMQLAFGSDNYCARIGGDEFIVYLPNAESKEAVCALTEKFFAALKEHKSSQGVDITCSVGIVCPMPENFDKAYKQADAAMYTAKRKGKNTYCVF